MEFKPDAGGEISKQKFKERVDRYRKDYPGKLQASYFGREYFEKLLQVPGAVGIRVYNGVNEKGELSHQMCAVDEKGENIDTTLINESLPCPPVCPGLWP